MPDINRPTLADHAKRMDPDGSIAAIVEIMNETNEILTDAVWVEGNLPTGHRTTVRTDVPRATWRKLNFGVQNTKSKTQQVTDTIGMLETYAEVDKDLADLNGNTAAFRLSEDRPHIEGMNQDLATTIIYGDTAIYPERFLGLAPRYDALGNPDKPGFNYMNQVIGAGGTAAGEQTSVWLVVWGENTVHMIFPKGSKAGLLNEDLGQKTLFDSAGGKFEGYRSHYQQKPGMCVRDWRYIVRIANVHAIDPQTEFDYKNMIQAFNTIPSMGMGNAVFYCNRTVKTQIDIAAAEKTNAALKIGEEFGKPVTSFWGVPIRQVDAILNTEDPLT
jgi:hypothetical protein